MKQTKRWMSVAFALVGGIIGGAAAAQMGASGALAATHGQRVRTVEAERFVVVGPHGEDRVAKQVTGHGIADIALSDAQGRTRAELRVTPEGTAGLGFYNADGAKRLMVGLSGDNRRRRNLFERWTSTYGDGGQGQWRHVAHALRGVARAGLGLAADGSPALVMFDKRGKERAELSLDRNAQPSLLVADDTGKTVAALPTPGRRRARGGQ